MQANDSITGFVCRPVEYSHCENRRISFEKFTPSSERRHRRIHQDFPSKGCHGISQQVNQHFTFSRFLEFSKYQEVLAFIFTHLSFNGGQSPEKTKTNFITLTTRICVVFCFSRKIPPRETKFYYCGIK